jgi:hypothetical protein
MDELNSHRSKSCCRAGQKPLKIDAGTGTLTALALGASRMILFVM